jgi:nitrite reductase/ring-hydroxylating ferredoxin subunit
MKRYVVARVDEIPPGTRLIVDLDGRSVGIFNVDGSYYALRNNCPHQGAELCAGTVFGAVSSPGPGEYHYDPDRKLLACPWHNWEFDMRTGQSWFDPAKTRVRPYEVAVESAKAIQAGGDGRVPGPYVAETLDVTIEGDYVVVTP